MVYGINEINMLKIRSKYVRIKRMVNCECYESFTTDAELHEFNETNELIRMMEGKSTATTITTVMRRR